MEARVSPAVAVPIVGAPATTALTRHDRLTVEAVRQVLLPAWSALMVQVPAVTKVSAPPEVIVHTPVVLDEKLTVSPEVEVAVSVGVEPKLCAPGLLKVMVCARLLEVALVVAVVAEAGDVMLLKTILSKPIAK